MKDNNEMKRIIRIWKGGNDSNTMVIPRDLAKGYGLDKPSHAVLEAKPDGILIRKLEL